MIKKMIVYKKKKNDIYSKKKFRDKKSKFM